MHKIDLAPACFVGIDPNGVRRVFAVHQNIDVAETWCYDAVRSYARKRPDCGSVNCWRIVFVGRNSDCDWQDFAPINS